MKLATLLMVILSNQAYWFGGQEGTITIREAARGGLPAADLSWELMFANVRLGNGRVAMAAHDGETTVRMALPQCRVRLSLHWIYRLTARGTGQVLDQGDIPVQLFPDELLGDLSARLQRKRLVVWDRVQGIPAALDTAKTPYARVTSESSLQFVKADVVLVGADSLGNSVFEQATLRALAEGGASVMIFEQKSADRLMGYNIAKRNAPPQLEWRLDHPLLRDFQPEDLQSWIAAMPTLSVVQLPAEAPALDLGYCSPEIPVNQPWPTDAVLVTETIGAGRFVLCQIPLGDWAHDPRSQILLRNAIDYLLTRPQPTPRPSDRLIPGPVALPQIPTIPLSPEGLP
jgi:hypothetical protein